MDNKQLGIIGAIVIIIVIIVRAFAFLGGNTNNPTNVANSDNSNTNSTSNSTSGGSDAAYQLQINTTGKWRLDLTVDGKYSSYEGEGSRTIDLGPSLSSASVTVNQYSNGPTDVYLLKNNQTISDGHSKGEGVETIYFYYQA